MPGFVVEVCSRGHTTTGPSVGLEDEQSGIVNHVCLDIKYCSRDEERHTPYTTTRFFLALSARDSQRDFSWLLAVVRIHIAPDSTFLLYSPLQIAGTLEGFALPFNMAPLLWRTIILALVGFGQGYTTRIEEQFEKCCQVGTAWANEDLRCEKFSGPVVGVPALEQGMCLETVDICCVRAYHEKNCEKGKKDAREGLACIKTSNAHNCSSRSDVQRDCCEGCKLGILTGSLGQKCAFKSFSFGKPWDPAFLECCHETTSTVPTDSSSTVTTANTTTKTTTGGSTSDSDIFPPITDGNLPTPVVDDICQLMKDLLCSDICVPTVGSYYCACPEGKILLEDGKTCRTDGPPDRCDLDNPCEHRCTDTGTVIKCECDRGFNLAKDGHSCELEVATTTSTTPRYRPQNQTKFKCPPGYKYNSSIRVCDDIDECEEESPCPADSVCKNLVGSFVCSTKETSNREGMPQVRKDTCPPGYKWSTEAQTCADIDECIESPCPNDTHQCVNTQGSFACHELTVGKSCPAGFKFDLEKKTCQDVDECAEGLHECLAEVEECRNTEGAYDCDVRCSKGYTFSHSSGICIDINECLQLENPCPTITPVCINTPGRYLCKEGTIDHEEHANVHDNEIADRQYEVEHEIEKKSRLNDKVNGEIGDLPVSLPLRNACDPGYREAGERCVDVDECSEGPGCQDHERCINRPGGYDCRPLCVAGWFFDRVAKQCRDVDECLLGRHDCLQDSQVCRNTNGSFVCDDVSSCMAGFRRAFNGTCVDIDECVEGVHNCPLVLHQYCMNRQGSFECVTRLPDCMDGYRYSLATKRCEDVDECLENAATLCDARLAERCINLPGSYRCERPPSIVSPPRQRPACPSGYRYHSRTRQCEDVDECAEKLDSCGSQVCYNQPGGYSCADAPKPITEAPAEEREPPRSTVGLQKCQEGFKYVQNRGCIDVNECTEIEDACSSNEDCLNTGGSYSCACRVGFRRDNFTQACVDINECQLLQNDCLPTQRCDNTLGSYNCVRFLPCGTGYTLNAATEICEDDDECILGTHDCSDGYHCRNTLGSYRCDRNLRGQIWTTRPTTTSIARPITTTTTTTTIIPTIISVPTFASRIQEENPCPSGFMRTPDNRCQDINECQTRPCRAVLERCVNTVGSFRCVPRVVCGPGWKLDLVSGRCQDVNECDEGNHECHSGQTCENRQGGYVCSCPAGHALGPNRDCIDIDECSVYSSNICGTYGRCENTVGSYKCVCERGFESLPGSSHCRDIDECASNRANCQHSCVNVWGGYQCTCKPGYRLKPDNRSCSDIDECQEFKDNNLCVGLCDNTPGSYVCRCPDGYRLGDDLRTCQDIDECASGGVCREPSEMCQNTRGGFRCNRINCPPGYQIDPTRRNRCVRTSRYCPSTDIACLRSPSHFSFNFITFVSMLPIPQTGQLELFTMKGTHLPSSIVRFSMALVEANAPPGVMRVTESFFALRRPTPSQAVLVLTRSIAGPQEISLELTMEIYHNTAFMGSAVAKLLIIVTQYEF